MKNGFTIWSGGFGFVLVWMAIAGPVSCTRTEPTGEQLATTYCASCHHYADPALLDKDTWQKSVLPRMALRMGLITDTSSVARYGDQLAELETGIREGYLPAQPMISMANWQKIVQFYGAKAPAKLTLSPSDSVGKLTLFTPETPRQPLLPLTTFVKIDPATRTLRVGNRRGDVVTISSDLQQTDSLHLSSPPSDALRLLPKSDFSYLLMGIMDPNDQAAGQLWSGGRAVRDSLRRPVQMASGDLDRDGQTDLVVCQFGHNIGKLSAFFKTGNTYREQVIDPIPGARRAIVRDLNNDGWPDILALLTQGDEQVAVYLNGQNGKFKKKTLLRFPPVYGSSYLELADMNRDGHLDIICTNGDNADYSTIPKPYHGIRVYLNDGSFGFKEAWFYAMPGASQALARDFDGDGDMDLAAISFFPLMDDTKRKPAQVFVYLENKGNLKFTPQTWVGADNGRWLVMDAADLDGDGDDDIALGSFYRSVSPTPPIWADHWLQAKTGLVVLRNRKR